MKDREKKQELREKYQKEAAINKHKFKIAQRDFQRSKSDIIKETGKYSIRFMFLKTDDEILYKYKRKLQKEIQWKIAWNQFMPAFFSTCIYMIVRRLKQKAPSDVGYFFGPYMYVNYGIFID